MRTALWVESTFEDNQFLIKRCILKTKLFCFQFPFSCTICTLPIVESLYNLYMSYCKIFTCPTVQSVRFLCIFPSLQYVQYVHVLLYREEITQAVRRAVNKVQTNQIQSQDIDEKLIGDHGSEQLIRTLIF